MNSSPNTDRSRLARELHDGLAQELAAIGYRLDSVIGSDSLAQSSRTQLRELRVNISALIELVRNEIFELRNESKRSFAQSITSQIEVLLSGSNISFEIIGKANIKGDDEYELLRSIRELILNSIAHSNCQNIKIELSDKLITYSDDGQFVDSIKNNNYGLIGLQERLTRLGGSLRRLGSTYEIKLP